VIQAHSLALCSGEKYFWAFFMFIISGGCHEIEKCLFVPGLIFFSGSARGFLGRYHGIQGLREQMRK
jgi:hypothetical protein